MAEIETLIKLAEDQIKAIYADQLNIHQAYQDRIRREYALHENTLRDLDRRRFRELEPLEKTKQAIVEQIAKARAMTLTVPQIITMEPTKASSTC